MNRPSEHFALPSVHKNCAPLDFASTPHPNDNTLQSIVPYITNQHSHCPTTSGGEATAVLLSSTIVLLSSLSLPSAPLPVTARSRLSHSKQPSSYPFSLTAMVRASFSHIASALASWLLFVCLRARAGHLLSSALPTSCAYVLRCLSLFVASLCRRLVR